MLERFKVSVLSALVLIACVGSLVLACGNGDNGTTMGGGTAGAGASAGAGAGGAGTAGDGVGGFGGDVNNGQLTVDPPMAMLTITDKAVPVMQGFTASFGGTKVPDAVWSLDNYSLGDIAGGGVFASVGLVGGKA